MIASGTAVSDPRPDDVRRAIERVSARWRQLPLDQAERHSVQVHAVAQRFADLASGPDRSAPLPVLGPTVVIDQLRVTTYDACAAALSNSCAEELRQLLGQLR